MSFSGSASPAARLTDAAARVADRLGADDLGVAGLDDDELLGLLTDATEARKALELIVAAGSAEVAAGPLATSDTAGWRRRRGTARALRSCSRSPAWAAVM